ncbi:branched-chain amino acid aminotransferase, partial [Streptomyces boncukensis]
APVPGRPPREEILERPGFGRFFTDHMVLISWDTAHGWHDVRMARHGPLPVDPAAMALHYGQSVFEGLKAHRRPGGKAAALRPEENARRFRASARRLAMPELPEKTFLASLDALVRMDRDWIPQRPGQSLYLRPFMVATEAALSVRAADSYLFAVIASPVDGYFSSGPEPVSVWVSEEYVRAAPGGTGAAKTGANYAASLAGQAEATAHGCDQVVWLDARERRWVEEMGAMNIFFVYGDLLVTPGLTGSLLPGITRSSLLTLARDLGYRVRERGVSLEDWRRDAADGSLTEVFACGTAAGVTPVGAVRSARADWTVGDGRAGPVTTRLRTELLALQEGTAPDPHGWMHELGGPGPVALSWPAADLRGLLSDPRP